MTNTVEITFELIDKVSNRARNLGATLSGIGSSMSSVGQSLLPVTGAIVGAGAAIGGLAVSAESLMGVRSAFEGLAESAGRSADEMLGALQDSSRGMVSNRDLMLSFNKASQLVSEDFATQLPEAFGALSKVAASTGQDMGFLLDSLVTGVGRLSPMILDNLGIQVDLNAAYETYAASVGKTVDELTKQEQQTALTNQVLEKLADNTASMPDASSNFASMTTALANMRDEVGTALLPVVAPLMESLTALAVDIAPKIVGAIGGMVSWFTELSPTMQNVLLGVVGLAAGLGPLLIALGSVITAVGTVSTAFGALGALISGPAFAGVLATIMGVLTGPFLLAIGAVAAVVAGLVIAWRNDWGNIREITATVLDGIKQLFEVSMQNLQIVFDIFRAAFEGNWYEFGAKIRELFANTWNGIVAILSGIWSRFQPVLANLWGSIRAWWGSIDWGELGRNIVNGIIGGITGSVGAIADAARGAAQAALDAAKGLLGIRSPSRVFAEEVGKPSVQGMLQPFKDARAIEASLANSFGRINLPSMNEARGRLDIGISVSDASTRLESTLIPVIRATVQAEMANQGRYAAAHIRP